MAIRTMVVPIRIPLSQHRQRSALFTSHENDKNPYPHDRRVDKDSYPHDSNNQCVILRLQLSFSTINVQMMLV